MSVPFFPDWGLGRCIGESSEGLNLADPPGPKGGQQQMKSSLGIRAALLAAIVVIATALDPLAAEAAGLDGFNRANRRFNFWVLDHVFEPVARGYNFVMPKWGQTRVRNVLENLQRPRDFVNSLLQAKLGRAGRHLGALMIDSTIGIGGAFRPSERILAPESPETAGETLGVYGIPAGPYVVLPLYGETCPRCLAGQVGDLVLYPIFWLTGSIFVSAGTGVVGGVNLLARQMPGRGAEEDEWEAYRARLWTRPEYEEARQLFRENLELDVYD
jgi:phospholipid-binding lipoprotein MlaA